MKSVPLKAYPRTQSRRNGARKLRAAGRVPAVIYGRQAKPQNLELSAKEFGDLIHHSISENLLVDLSVENDARAKRLALVQEIQHHPLEGDVLHVDFHEVTENEKVVILVPLETVGEAAGVKNAGGVLEHVVFKLKVRALPKDLPEQIIVDVSHLELGKSIHLGEHQGARRRRDPWRQEPFCHLRRHAAHGRGRSGCGCGGRGGVRRRRRNDQREEGRRRRGCCAGQGEKGAVKPGEKGAAAKPGEKVPAKPGEKAPAKGVPPRLRRRVPPSPAKKPRRRKPAERKK